MKRQKTPCEGFETACLEAAWGLGDTPEWVEHRRVCARCREAERSAREFAACCREADLPPPASILRGLASEVFAHTTRRAPSPSARWRLAWAGGAAAMALASAAVVTLLRGRRRGRPEPGFAEVDPELLEELEVAEDLDILEVLDALEEMDRA